MTVEVEAVSMAVVSISMPDTLVEAIDRYADRHGYSGRSEVVRNGARDLLSEFDDTAAEHVCVVSVTFDHGSTDIERRLSEIRHEHDELVSATAHSHVADGYCTELFVIEGDRERTASFVGRLRSVSEIVAVEHSVQQLDGFESRTTD